MSKTAFLSIWVRSKVLYEPRWLNRQGKLVPSSLVVAKRTEKKAYMQFNTKASRRKTKNQKGKKELKYRVERLFLSISKWLPPIIECILPLISSCPQLANFAKMIQNTTSVIPAKSPDAAQPRLPSRALLWGSSSIQCNRALLANGPARAKR